MEAALPDSKSPDSQTYTHKSAIETINTTTLTALLAAVYVATGYLGTLLAIPPGNVSILWPPSGIAMAAMLVCGPRASLGILLGAIIVNGQAFFDSSPIADQIPAIIAALTIGIGSVLQPLAGRYLIIKFSNSDDPFKDGGTILKSGGLFAVTCLISSNIGSLSLVLTGIADGPAFSIFQTWWLGDFIGVMVFAPLFLAIFKQSRVNAATLVLATVISFGGTFYVSEQVRGSAEDAWDTSATREAERLTTTLVSWLETAISPINSIGALFESSDDVFEDEFLEASIRLEDFQPDFFPSVLSIVATIPGAGAENDWEVLYSTNETGFLTPGDIIEDGGIGIQALNAALDEPGRLVIGEFAELDGEQVAMAALAIERSDFEQVAIGVLNLTQMFDGLFAVQVPDGFHVTVDGAGSAETSEDLKTIYSLWDENEALLVTKTIRGTSGNAPLTFNWGATDKFLPGSRTDLPNAVLVGGILGSAVLILFLTFVLGQNAQIRQRVRERTAELDRERAVLQTTMEAMDQGLSMFDSELVLTARNNKFMDMLNLPQAVFPIGSHIDQMLRHHAQSGEYGDGDIDQLVQERVDLASKFEPHRFERQRPDGSYLEIRGNPLPNGEGFVTTYTDITDRKKAEQEIAEKQAALQMTLDNMPGGICMLDGDLNIQVVNDKYCELYGHDPEVYRVGRPIREIVSINVEAGMHAAGDHVSDSVEETIQRRMSAFRSGVAGQSERELPNGRTLHIRHNPIDGGGVVIVATDITESKQAQEEIAEKEALLSAALENMTGGLFMIDADLKLRVFNDRLSEFYDVHTSTLKVGSPLADLLRIRAERGDYGPGDPEKLLQVRLDSYRKRDVQIVTDYVGDTIIEVYRAPMDDGGMVCVFNDVTERKRAEEELNKAHSLITESLTYASRIQRSLLPPKTILEEIFKDHCVIWEPTATVGGDMVWLRPSATGVYLIVADCTGHGPPGAFMTMICTGALDQSLAEIEDADPAEVLRRMNKRIKTALGQDSEHGESDDGVELGVCHIQNKSQTIIFAGARFSLEIIENKEMTEIKGNKSAIGYRHVPNNAEFDNHTLSYNADMQFYMWTDGMVDQIGGPKRRSFGKRRLRKIIMDYSQMGMAWQRSQILREFEDYQHTEGRRDDITLVGFVPKKS